MKALIIGAALAVFAISAAAQQSAPQKSAGLGKAQASANEELNTVNDELRHRNEELARVNNDLINLLSGVNIPIIMVSRELRIRRYTPLAEKLFNLIPTDLGRPISDIKPNLRVADLPQLIVFRGLPGAGGDIPQSTLH